MAATKKKTTKPKKPTTKSKTKSKAKKGSNSIVGKISARAKQLYQGGKGEVKKWTTAISKASKELKKAGTI